MRIKHLLKTTALTALLLIGAKVGWGQAFTFTSGSLTYSENFDVMGATGTTYPTGWTAIRYSGTGTLNQTLTLVVTDGTTSSGGILNVGTASATDRCIGALGSGSTVPAYGASLVNNTGKAISDLAFSFVLEQWKTGSLSTVNEKNIFQYSLDATSLSTGTWVAVTSLDLNEILTSATDNLKVDGNLVANKLSMNATISNVALANGATIWFRWIDDNAGGNDCILAVDDLSITATMDVIAPSPVYTPASDATGVEIASNITVNYGEHVYKLDGTEVTDNDATVIGLKKSGADVLFTYTISADKKIITIDPTDPFDYNSTYNVTASVEDASGNESVTSINFTTRAKYTTATVSSTDYTVTGDPTWTISIIPGGVNVETFEGKIFSVENSTFETYESTGTTPIATGTPVVSGDKVKVTSEDGLTTNTYTLAVTPVLVVDATDNNVDNNIDIAFDYDATWYAAILKVYVNNVELTQGADYGFAATTKAPTVNALRLMPSATSNAVLKAAGTWNVKITATGYADATVSQTVNPGAVSETISTVSVSPALALSTTSTVTATAKDQYGNVVPLYIFKFDLTVKNDVATTTESYTVDGTDYTATVSDAPLKSVTNALGVVTFDIAVPATVDEGDGLSVQLQLSNGSTNVGSALEYYTPVGPSVNITGTFSENSLNNSTIALTLLGTGNVFANTTLDKANYTLADAPAGVTISDVTYNTTTTATITLAYDGTDFDTDSTNVTVTVAGAELALGNPLTSANKLTVTAVVETAPVVTTAATVTTNGLTTATWEGTITSDGGEAVTEKGICWGATADPTTADSKIADASVGTTITGNLTGLTANTLYHVRAYATNVEGTTYGEDRTFTTLLSSAKAIVSTTIGSVDETNKLVISVPATTTVADLKAALTVSPNATFEIYTAPAGTTVATGTTVLSTVKNYVIRVKAQDLTTQEYGIGLVYTETTIHDIQYTTDASGDSPKLNQIVKFKGIVTAIKGGSYQSAYVQDGVGAWSAVYAFSIPTTTTVAEGDSVSIEGFVKEYNKLTEIDPVYRVTVINQGNTLPEAAVITTQVAGSSEAYESVLIQVKWAKCTSITYNTATPPVATGGVLNDGSGDLTAYYSLYSGLTFTVNNRYNVTGVMTWFNTGSIYEIYPRRSSDVSDVTGINDNTLSNLTVYPNPFSNEIKIDATQNVKRIVISSITGQVVKNEIIVGTSVNTESLPKGMYLVTLFNDKGEKTTLKMIKQ